MPSQGEKSIVRRDRIITVTIWAIGLAWLVIIFSTRNWLFYLSALVIFFAYILFRVRQDIDVYIHPKAAQQNNYGVKCLELGQFEKAVAFFDEAIRLYPKFALAYSNRGLSNINLGLSESAISDANKRSVTNQPYQMRM